MIQTVCYCIWQEYHWIVNFETNLMTMNSTSIIIVTGSPWDASSINGSPQIGISKMLDSHNFSNNYDYANMTAQSDVMLILTHWYYASVSRFFWTKPRRVNRFQKLKPWANIIVAFFCFYDKGLSGWKMPLCSISVRFKRSLVKHDQLHSIYIRWHWSLR